jgi:hypothetical protein
MRPRWYALFGIFSLLCLLIDALSFGALSREAGVGEAITASADAEAPVARTSIRPSFSRTWKIRSGS